MAPDAERLWRLVQNDSNVKMTALTVGDVSQDWLKEYRQYTDLSMPIGDGTDLARSFGVVFLPAVVIVAPNSNRAYLKTGQQGFDRLYEFLRTVQGLPAIVTARYQELATALIGEAERLKAGQGASIQPAAFTAAANDSGPKRVSIERF